MKKFGLSGIIGVAALLIFSVILAGCENEPSPTGGGGGNPVTRAFSVSGTFDRSGERTVRFEVTSDGASRSVLNRAIATDSYTISGVLEDEDFTIRLRGSYDPNAGTWSVSAKSTNIIYTIDGKVDGAGVSQGSSATIVVQNGNEWVPYIFPVTEEKVAIPDAATVEESVTGGLPSFAQGYWRVNMNTPPGYSVSISALISDWKIRLIGAATSPVGSQPIDDSFTVIEHTAIGDHEIIVCFPEYVMTSANFAEAIAAYLGNGVVVTALDAPENMPFSGRWAYVAPGGDTIVTGGFTDEEYEKLNVFSATGGWENWAAANGVEKVNKFVKFKLGFGNGNTIFDMIYMAEGNPEDYTVAFPTLAALKEATLAEVSIPNGGVYKMTFTR